jgi:hypothetical protein
MTKEGLLQKEIAASVFFAVLLFRPNKHQALTLIGAQKHDAVVFESPAHLIPRAFVDLEAALGLKALQRGQGNLGLVSERLLRPSKQRARGPRLSGGDNA